MRRVKRKSAREVFVCERCGMKQTLEREKRHWCENCASQGSVEMHPARTRQYRSAQPAPN